MSKKDNRKDRIKKIKRKIHTFLLMYPILYAQASIADKRKWLERRATKLMDFVHGRIPSASGMLMDTDYADIWVEIVAYYKFPPSFEMGYGKPKEATETLNSIMLYLSMSDEDV